MTDQNNPTETNTTETKTKDGKRTWVEEIEVNGRDAVGRVQDLIQEGNVRRLIIMTDEDRILLEIPLTVGVAIGIGTVMLSAPLAAVGAVAAFLARVKIRIIREEDDSDSTDV